MPIRQTPRAWVLGWLYILWGSAQQSPENNSMFYYFQYTGGKFCLVSNLHSYTFFLLPPIPALLVKWHSEGLAWPGMCPAKSTMFVPLWIIHAVRVSMVPPSPAHVMQSRVMCAWGANVQQVPAQYQWPGYATVLVHHIAVSISLNCSVIVKCFYANASHYMPFIFNITRNSPNIGVGTTGAPGAGAPFYFSVGLCNTKTRRQ